MAQANGIPNPLDSTAKLEPGSADDATKQANAQTEIFSTDSATTKAEKIERRDVDGNDPNERSAKRVKLDTEQELAAAEPPEKPRVKGVASIKEEYLIPHIPGRQQAPADGPDDDAAEAVGKAEPNGNGKDKKSKRQKGEKGQNKARTFGSSRDELQLCSSRSRFNEFSHGECRFKENCRFEHDLRKYISQGKRGDLDTFGGICPVFAARGNCDAGWKCRFVGSHSEEKTHEDGRKELVLISKDSATGETAAEEEGKPGVVNVVSVGDKITLRKKQMKLPKSDEYNKWLDQRQKNLDKAYAETDGPQENADLRANYVETPLRPSEKRRIYYGSETPILAPLTTQGNLPFRRLCVSLGAQVTWSEMAMGLPLLQGEKSEWALLKAHESELSPPKYSPKSILAGYDNSKDIRFGAQIAANKPWLATKTAEVLTTLCPNLRAIDLNCGCPIELVYRQGAGSALMDNPGRLEKILRGMNTVSKDVPITVKIRMGTKDNVPTADKLVQRLVLGGGESKELGEGGAGVAAITLHGRSRQQRYTRSADWEYIAETAATIERLRSAEAANTDTVREVDARNQSANGVYFIGNGDCYSHEDYYSHLKDAKVDSVMIARGALIKPWVFEEIEAGQYLDKSAKERLNYVEQFAKFGLEYWGSDEVGVGTTRRFLLEWLSFSCRYVPIGLLEHLPPRLGDRPPPYKGRDELETLMCSPNYKDWIKISEMFLGPATKDFQFQPKHKSNSYEIEAEG
ncbi:tRNA-dihydrouridine(47) synthase [NAD(P)(+)] [Myriangium duriaei CBS 260.36]|uniref:tRNA-dihydrouridine(47) synthase [NAD(P)(+)] n=1 Tax=Myriangium duriaei CBS 260.36 TaxID=1168546 RepID=A0A9P4IR56_9PEZI|nr:tRNA-dihydrouridine(47) synthase [NAD(P)(+)] [Myriangium duriaei CBS 260.36]